MRVRINFATRGARISAFSWIQSLVREDGQPTLLFDLDMAIQRISGEAPDHPSVIQLNRRLSRLASDVGRALGIADLKIL